MRPHAPSSGPENPFRFSGVAAITRGRVLGLELPLILLILVFAELGAVLYELRTDVILDWFVSMAPLVWINVSVLFIYAFLRLYRSPRLASAATGGGRKAAESFLVPNFRAIRAQGERFRATWTGAAVAYGFAFMILQGMLVVDLSGSIEPISAVLESPVGYGPGIVWAPNPLVGIVIRPYAVASLVALSFLSGLVVALSIRVFTASRRAAGALPSPLLGFAVMCPACVGAPASALFLAYAAPFASMGGIGAASEFSQMLALSTALLVGTLALLWIVISVLSNLLLPMLSGASRNHRLSVDTD